MAEGNESNTSDIPPFSADQLLKEVLARPRDLDMATDMEAKIHQALLLMLLEDPKQYKNEHLALIKGYYDMLLKNREYRIDELNVRRVDLESRLEDLTEEFAELQQQLQEKKTKQNNKRNKF
ncbi:uncharacterized protein LOC108606173 [Drosophila busckii]|uniref:uncharacterized protein LOC108606173 n=1 Tax=Drosophila busckii TaxID=30019 RepID=UPI00083F0E56|nr:uncharacterized protein LOC108606173 [Drosophila busckii]XP_017851513.1 uncharacterized protein LOC108606173 [Drosophila busckii]